MTGISLAGHTWNLWSGPNSNWKVFSFVSASGDINTFSADLNVFFRKFVSGYHDIFSVKNREQNTSSNTRESLDLKYVSRVLINISTNTAVQYVQSIQSGTEPFTGSANLVISSYSVALNRGTPSSSSSSPSSTSSTATSSPTSGGGGGSGTVAHYGQCGGQGWTGGTVCVSPYTCQVSNAYYSQCL